MKTYIYYNAVPRCPRCNNSRTGYYIKYSGKEKNKIIAEKLKKGEIVFPLNSTILPANNLYCEECGVEWAGNVKKIKITKEDLILILKEKNILEEDIFEIKNNSHYQGFLSFDQTIKEDLACNTKPKKTSKLFGFISNIAKSSMERTKRSLKSDLDFITRKQVKEIHNGKNK